MPATMRNNFKKIDMLVSDDAMEVKDQVGMCKIAKNYFEKLFTGKEGRHDPVLTIIQLIISHEGNDILVAPVFKEELYKDLIHMNSDKSLGPDSFNPAFYHKFWDL